MSGIEGLARERGVALRAGVSRTLDVEAALRDLHRRHRRRRVQVVSAALAAAAVVALVVGLSTGRDPRTDGRQPVTPPDLHRSCEERPPAADCLPAGRVHVEASTPFSVEVPASFRPPFPNADTVTVDAFRTNTPESTGVTFLDRVGAGRHSATMTAAELAHWVASRPYLHHESPVRTTVGGRPAWQIAVSVTRAPLRLAAACNGTGELCWPMLGSRRAGAPPWVTGPRPDMVSRYTFVDLPSGRTLGIWSWSYSDDFSSLAGNDELIRSVHFGSS